MRARWWYKGEKKQITYKIKLFISKTIKMYTRGSHNYFFILDGTILFCLSGVFILSLRVFTPKLCNMCTSY